jgi:hypothetical protein
MVGVELRAGWWRTSSAQLSDGRLKDLIATTRKYAVPLMELFDAEHLTVRRGETRVLRRGRG